MSCNDNADGICMTENRLKINILYDDKELTVAVKPSGILSEHTEKNDGFPDILAASLPEKAELYSVHRLDGPTAGVMVFAKTKAAAAALSADFSNGKVKKEYLAVLCGCPDETHDELTDLLFYDKRSSKSYVEHRMRKGVREATLEYSVVDTAEKDGMKLTLVKVMLKTGRTHQIRAQFASRRLPLFADRRYGGKGNGNIGLFCRSITFEHPLNGRVMTFESPVDNVCPWTLFGSIEKNQ